VRASVVLIVRQLSQPPRTRVIVASEIIIANGVGYSLVLVRADYGRRAGAELIAPRDEFVEAQSWRFSARPHPG